MADQRQQGAPNPPQVRDHIYLSWWMIHNPTPVPTEGVTVELAEDGAETPQWDGLGRVLLSEGQIASLRESLKGFMPTWNLPPEDGDV